jgi:hypothetical protein
VFSGGGQQLQQPIARVVMFLYWAESRDDLIDVPSAHYRRALKLRSTSDNRLLMHMTSAFNAAYIDVHFMSERHH